MSDKPISKKVNRIGRVIKASGAARFYHDGDGAGFVWRAWHPVAWVCAPLFSSLPFFSKASQRRSVTGTKLGSA